MATTWTISRRQGICAKTGHEFGDGERHVSLLRVNEGNLERMDLAMPAWREMRAKIEAGDPSEEEPLFWWMTRHEVAKKKSVQLDMESLSALFVSLEGREEVPVRELRYVLCLLLMRKRRVKVEKVLREDGVESFIVKRPREDTRYKVYVYDFEPEHLDQVRAQLQAVFDGSEGPSGVRLSGEDEGSAIEPAGESGGGAAESESADPASQEDEAVTDADPVSDPEGDSDVEPDVEPE